MLTKPLPDTHHGVDRCDHATVNGTPLISINTEYYSDIDRGGKEPFQRISAEQLKWLDERLAHWDKQGVTALVFTHPLLPGTVSMSHSAWYQNDFEDEQAISDVLSKYNDIVAFTSHSHSSLKQNNWWGTRRYDGTPQGAIGFPVVNTGAILNEYLPDGDHDEEIVDDKAATGLRVKVYDDRIRVEAWDFKDGHSLLNPDGEAKMIKYQDFAKQHRLSTPPVNPPSPPPHRGPGVRAARRWNRPSQSWKPFGCPFRCFSFRSATSVGRMHAKVPPFSRRKSKNAPVEDVGWRPEGYWGCASTTSIPCERSSSTNAEGASASVITTSMSVSGAKLTT